MATQLQQQLAQIAANSTHQLDLKAQKARHSKSFLFEPRDAATQSFDTIYQLCYEGFEELCALDSRFVAYGRNIFSEQSKNEDRTQMTAKENGDLNQILETFLGLVGRTLLLKPAMKAVEWLVRRFRVQEYNTECVLLTFLPYHTSHIFPTLLSILPDQLPPSFKFLQPYRASLQSPPRNAILSAAVGNQNFFSAFNNYVLKVAKAKHHSAILLGFWASITAQAVNGMIDTSRSGRDAIRKQREEDLLLRILPILQSALNLQGIPELYLGACMIITILATRANLEDKALDAMMEAIAGSWADETISEGIMCLAVVAEEKQHPPIPTTVAKAIIQTDGVLQELASLAKSQRVSKLAAGVALNCIHMAVKKKDATLISTAQQLLGAHFMSDQHALVVLEKLLSTASRLRATDLSSDVSRAISDLLMTCTNESEDFKLLEQAGRDAKISLSALQLIPLDAQDDSAMDIDLLTEAATETTPDESEAQARFDTLLQTLPSLPEAYTSFLDVNFARQTFQQYADAFQASLSSSRQTEQFLALLQFHRGQAHSRPEFFSFLARVWSSNITVAARVAALNSTREAAKTVKETGKVFDAQNLLPAMILALSDPSAKVRHAAAELCKTLSTFYDDYPSDQGPLGDICGPAVQLKHVLNSIDVAKFLKSVLLPALEDAILDKDYIKQLIIDIINENRDADAKSIDSSAGAFKKSFRGDICLFLASHLASPVMRGKLPLLQILNGLGKMASQARSQLVLPFVRQYIKLSEEELVSRLKAEGILTPDMDKAVLGSVTHRSADEIQLIKEIATGEIGTRDEIIPLAFERLSQIFPAAKGAQLEIADWLLDLALGTSDSSSAQSQGEALQTLRALTLTTEMLVHLVETMPKVADLQEHPPSKKRRMSSNESAQLRAVDHSKLQASLRHITLVLELVESSNPAHHPALLRGLFHALSELHHFKTLLGSELVYTFQILLGCILTVVDGLRTQSTAYVDRTVIRTDLIVECVRTTSSTQIHNTALLLVSSLAGWAPELVLHCVMPLFTFMSSTLLRQSDSFSAHVTDHTVERIVPPLAASLKKKGKNLVVGASELLLSFTAAFEHIPLHRRAGLFKHLVETLGPEETLFAVVAMLVERYPNDSAVSSFVGELVNQFSSLTAIRASKQYLDLIADTLKPKRSLSDILLSFGDKDVAEKAESQETLLEGLATLLKSSNFRQSLATDLLETAEHANPIQDTYASLLGRTMQLNRELVAHARLKTAGNSLLLSVLGLMPMKNFIDSSAQLMQTGSDETRQQVFRALEARVSEAKANDTTARQIFLNVLPNCGVFLREDQPVATRHAAVSCIDQICERYGKAARSAVLDVAKQAAGDFALGSDDVSLRVMSMLCLASMIEVLEDDCIPILPDILTRVLTDLDEDLDRENDSNRHLTDGPKPRPQLQAAGFALLNSVLDHLPWILADQYLDRALCLANKGQYLTPDVDALQEFAELAAKKVGPSQMFNGLHQTFNVVYRTDVYPYHLRIFHSAIRHHNKATITKNSRIIFDILFQAFDLRRTMYIHKETEDQWSDIFELIDAIALDVTLKLNDATFRPFFLSLVDWATKNFRDKYAEGAYTLRLISLYSFSLTLFEQLKSIVTSYTAFILENASEVLKKPPMGTYWDVELLDYVLRTLSSSFNHDQDEFWQSPAHFDAVAVSLVDQLQRTKVSPLIDQVIATITDLAAAARSQEHLKGMNAAIMGHLRSTDAAVRLAAVKCQRSLTERLAVDWLDLLPEMLPIISELHEDDSEDVERETLRWAREIEEITGESLDPMLA